MKRLLSIALIVAVVLLLADKFAFAQSIDKSIQQAQDKPFGKAQDKPNHVYVDFGELYIIKGTSMQPVLKDGEIAIVRMCKTHTLKEGQLIVYNDYFQGPVLHRIISVGNDAQGWYAATRGDTLPEQDPYYVRQSNFIGQAIGVFWK